MMRILLMTIKSDVQRWRNKFNVVGNCKDEEMNWMRSLFNGYVVKSLSPQYINSNWHKMG